MKIVLEIDNMETKDLDDIALEIVLSLKGNGVMVTNFWIDEDV